MYLIIKIIYPLHHICHYIYLLVNFHRPVSKRATSDLTFTSAISERLSQFLHGVSVYVLPVIRSFPPFATQVQLGWTRESTPGGQEDTPDQFTIECKVSSDIICGEIYTTNLYNHRRFIFHHITHND